MRLPSRPPTAAAAAQALSEAVDLNLPRLHVPDRLETGLTIVLPPPQAHYLANVLRRAPGARVKVFNGIDGEFLALIGNLKRERAELTLCQQLRPQQAEQPDVWLVFALLKRTPTDLVVQKATELGATAIIPVFTTRTNADRTNPDRLRAITIEAAEQSERLSIPALQPTRALNAVLADWPKDRRLIAAVERHASPRPRGQPDRKAGLLIGPEGGFTDTELDAVRACPFVEMASLGPRILRAETAAIVGLALLQAG